MNNTEDYQSKIHAIANRLNNDINDLLSCYADDRFDSHTKEFKVSFENIVGVKSYVESLIDEDNRKIDINCRCITEQGIEYNTFQIELKELNGWLIKIGSEYRYDDLKEYMDKGNGTIYLTSVVEFQY
jgi:hypothetical protein